MSTSPLFDMSQAKPIQAGGSPLFDMSQAKAIGGEKPKDDLYQQAREAYDKAHGKIGNPGVSEGAGLRGGLAEWDKASGGEIIGGLRDLFSGDVAKGLHRIITGGGAALSPTLPIAAAGAPVATALAAGAGGAGGYAAKTGAEALGATPDQAALAGDVGGLVAGAAGGAVPSITRPALARAGSAATAVGESLDPDIVGLVSPRLAHGLRLASKAGRVATKLSDVGEAALDATAENKAYAGERTPPVTPPPAGTEPPAPRIPDKLKPPIPGVNVPPNVGRIQTVIPTEPPAPANPDYVPFRPSIERIIDEVKNEPGFKNVSRADLDARFSKALAEVQQEAAQAPQPQDLTSKLQQTLDQIKARGKQMAPRVPKESLDDFNARLAKIADAKKAARSLEDLQ